MEELFVTGDELVAWAYVFGTRGKLPELVEHLIRATVYEDKLKKCDARKGAGVDFPGYDVSVEGTGDGFFVPDGQSVWEMGVDKTPRNKANRDYNERTADDLGIGRLQTTFVFVTPCRFPRKEQWKAEKLRQKKWHDIRVIDADDLHTWLRKEHAVHAWITEEIRKYPGPIDFLKTIWENWKLEAKRGGPAIPTFSNRDTKPEEILKHLNQSPPENTHKL